MGCSGPAGGERPVSMAIGCQKSDWRTPIGSGVAMSTRHYRVYTTSRNEMLLEHFGGFMEASYRNYLSITGLEDAPIGQPMVVYMMGTRDEWSALTKSIFDETHNRLYQSIRAGGYCYQKVCVFWDMGGMGTLSTAAHEGLHQLLGYRMGSQLPMWVEEGLCTLAEGYEIQGDTVLFTPGRNSSRYSDLRDNMMQGRWIPLKRLLPMDAGDAVTKATTEEAVGYYGQLWALALFIRSNDVYRAGLERMMRDAQSGNFMDAMGIPPEAIKRMQSQGRFYNRAVSERLFRHYISADLEKFEVEYRSFAGKLAGI